jgi:hypothetical protein
LMKFVRPARRYDSVGVALTKWAWTRSISGTPSMPAIAEYMDILARLSEVQLTQARPETHSDGVDSSYATHFIGIVRNTSLLAVMVLERHFTRLK